MTSAQSYNWLIGRAWLPSAFATKLRVYNQDDQTVRIHHVGPPFKVTTNYLSERCETRELRWHSWVSIWWMIIATSAERAASGAVELGGIAELQGIYCTENNPPFDNGSAERASQLQHIKPVERQSVFWFDESLVGACWHAPDKIRHDPSKFRFGATRAAWNCSLTGDATTTMVGSAWRAALPPSPGWLSLFRSHEGALL